MDWAKRFDAVSRYSGYTVALGTGGITGGAELQAALSRAKSSLTVLSRDGAWLAIEQLLATLPSAGVGLVAFQHVPASFSNRLPGFHVFAARQVRAIDLAAEQSFVASFGYWLSALKDLLPTFKLSPDAQSDVKGIVQAAGITDPILSAGLDVVLKFAAGSGHVLALVLLPATSVSADFATRWRNTDLIEGRIGHPWTTEWLWDVNTNDLYEPGWGRWEGRINTLFGRPTDLQNVLRTVGRQ